MFPVVRVEVDPVKGSEVALESAVLAAPIAAIARNSRRFIIIKSLKIAKLQISANYALHYGHFYAVKLMKLAW